MNKAVEIILERKTKDQIKLEDIQALSKMLEYVEEEVSKIVPNIRSFVTLARISMEQEIVARTRQIKADIAQSKPD